MVSVIVYTDQRNEYIGFECNGHAGFAEYGEDIVCSAVSMLVINTINSLEKFTNADMKVTSNQKKGNIKVTFQNKLDHDANLLLKSMILGIQETEKNYGDEFVKLISRNI